LKTISKVRLKPLLIDPKDQMKSQKEAGNTETLVEYDRFGQLAEQAKIIISTNSNESDVNTLNVDNEDIFNLQLLQNYVDHNHMAGLAPDENHNIAKHAIRGT
jgi:hypothetical protein